ncbi:protein adenylyltransferase SelO [Flavobacterium branchiicola]|uniref:Protein nucleotidyltransferase YdiU n=1 Tax=Flavobacterium branchiicola TaxID=1114875 RepID=A0ABV9PEW0_9FLAO|nr:YdiU family protein [Flavobacterium branchiicola]MBS7253847.1 YdiU family protein [Flavobacterium branchiicola]
MKNLKINNRFTTELPADPEVTNETRQVKNTVFSFVNPTKPGNPKLIHASEEVAEMVGISKDEIASEEFLNVFSGKEILPETKPFAMSYAGHQFGNWAGQLGDGRAINLTEVEHDNQFFMLQLKGAGKTPYSRTADGLAVLRSSIREYLCAEAMFHLGVPTTRSLSLMLSGDQVLRDVLYNGNPAYEKGAIVCRVAPSFIRFGSFEMLTARNELKNLKQFVEYTIKQYFPEIKGEPKEQYLQLFQKVADKTREMILHWQRVGFVHGVMNTDNMSIHGITIDYGPYGWLENYDPSWTPNTTDSQNRRYRFGNQPQIAQWNLYQLANAFYPLVNEAEPLEKILESFMIDFNSDYKEMFLSKLGLFTSIDADDKLISGLEAVLQLSETDMTIFFRNLSKVSNEDSVEKAMEKIEFSFYKTEEISGEILEAWKKWFTIYLERLKSETVSDEERSVKMNAVNPKYVLRNYMSQLAIDAADKEDYSLINELYTLLQKPYEEQPEFEKWFAKRPDWARSKVGCSMLSCSS